VERGSSPRYSLILATRHPKSLECWNPVLWHLDPNRGAGASAQLELPFGPDLDGLRRALFSFAGRPLAWSEAQQAALRAGYTSAHLRSVLNELGDDGLAVRTAPATARTPWPDGCTVVIFAPDVATDDQG